MMKDFWLSAPVPGGMLPTCVQFLVSFQEQLLAGNRPDLRFFLEQADDDQRKELFERLLNLEISHRLSQSESVSVQEYQGRFPEWSMEVVGIFSRLGKSPGEGFVESEVQEGTTVVHSPIAAEGSVLKNTLLWNPPPRDSAMRVPPGVPTQPLPSGASWPDHVGKYPVQGQLGEGGIGRVYLCQHPELQDPVAIKVIRHDRLNSIEDPLRLLLDEGQKLRQMSHSSARVVRVHDVGKTESGDPFLVMDYLPGGSLKKVLQDRGPLPWREAVELVADLAHTLTEVHAQDMYHRDIKPDNILFDNRGLPHLSDFGLASRFETLSIDMAGHSPGYASPEQLFKVVHLDGRSDLFSLGVVLYEALTGRRPVPFRTREEYKAKLADPFLVIPPIRQKIPDIPQDLDNLCLQLLQLNPVQRPTTAADVEQQLRRLMAPPSPPTPPAIPSRVWLYGGVVIACLGLPISVFSVLRPTPGVSHIPGAWGDVSGGIEQVIWPGHDGETTFSVDPQGKTLSLLTTTTCVVSLGQPKGRNFTLKVCVNPPSPGAMSGVCWNSRRETHDGITLLVFDAVLIESIQGNWTARLAVMNINPETGDLTVRQLRSDRVVIQLPSEKAVELTLRFTEEALLQVESPEFASPTRSLKGWHSFEKVENLGLFSSRSPAIFSRFQVLKTVD